ncbi:MAG: DUF805 domain-containing protein [Pseudomonadota bacterium]
MINPFHLFLGFNGRIGRLAYWIGLIVLVAISPFSIWTVLSQDPFRDALAAIQSLGVVGALWTLVLFVPLAALNTKRLHDLDQSGLHAVLFYAPAAIGTAKVFVGDTPAMADFAYWAGWALWLAGAAGLWFLVRLGFYRGTRGENRYGPQPGKRAAQATA